MISSSSSSFSNISDFSYSIEYCKAKCDKLQNEANVEVDFSNQSLLSSASNPVLFDLDDNFLRFLTNASLSASANNLSLSGMNHAKAIEFFKTILCKLKESPLLFPNQHEDSDEQKHLTTLITYCEQLSDQLNDSQSLEIDKASRAKKAIKNLKQGESYALPAGWGTTTGGHAMLIRFYKREGGIIDFFLYNAQDGSEGEQGGICHPSGKIQCFPYLKYEAIPEDLFTSEENAIIQTILALQNQNFEKDKEYSSETIRGLLMPISSFLKTESEGHHPIGVQSTGNCTIKSFNCMILDTVNNRDLFKKIMLEIRLQILIITYQSLQHHKDRLLIKKQRQVSHMLIQSAQSFLKYLRKYSTQSSSLNKDIILKGQATAHDLLNKLNTMNQEISASIRSEDVDSSINPADLNKEARNRKKALNHLNLYPPQSFYKHEVIRIDPEIGKDCTWDTLLHNLTYLCDKMKELNQSEAIIQCTSVFNHLRHLKFDRNSITHLDHQLSKDLVGSLSDTQNLYFTHVTNLGLASSREVQNTLIEMLAISHLAAEQCDKTRTWGKAAGHFSHHKVGLGPFELISKGRGYDCEDPDVLDHYNELLLFFQKLNQSKKGLQLDCFQENMSKSTVEKGLDAESNYFWQVVPFLADAHNDLNASKEKAQKQVKECLDFVVQLCELTKEQNNPKNPLHDKLKDVYLNLTYWIQYREILSKCVGASLIGTERLLNILDLYKISVTNYTVFRYQKCVSWSHYDQECHRMPFTLLDNSSKSLNFKFEEKASFFTELADTKLTSNQVDQIDSENTYIIKAIQSSSLNPNLIKELRPLASPETAPLVFLYELSKDPLILLNPLSRLQSNYALHKTIVNQSDTKRRSPLFDTIENHSELFLTYLNSFTKNCKEKWIALEEFQNNLEHLHAILFSLRTRAKLFYFYNQIKKRSVKSHYSTSSSSSSSSSSSHDFIPPLLNKEESLKLHRECIQWCKLIAEHVKEMASAYEETLRIQATLIMGIFIDEITDEELADLFIIMTKLPKNLEAASNPEDPVFMLANYQRYLNFITASKDRLKNSSEKIREKIDFARSDDFQRLFGNELFKYEVQGSDTLLFQNSKWGQITVTISEPPGSITQTIQRTIEGELYTYIPVEDCNQIQLNLGLIYDHASWRQNNKPHRLIVADLKTGKTLYETVDGALKSVKNNSTFSYQGSNENSISNHLTHFEDKGHTLLFVEDEQNEKYHLKLPRFLTQTGESLSFSYKGANWIYPPNPDYHIKSTQTQKYGIEKSLELESQDGLSGILLVPQSEIVAKAYQVDAQIITQNPNQDNSKGSMRYFEFEIQGDQLKAQTLNGKLYLAHLLISRKQYQQAYKALQDISESEQTDETTWKLLQNLLYSGKSSSDYSSKAAVLRLITYTIAYHIKPHQNILNLELQEILVNDYKTYLSKPDWTEEHLKLKEEQERLICDQLDLKPHIAEGFQIKLSQKQSQDWDFRLYKDWESNLYDSKEVNLSELTQKEKEFWDEICKAETEGALEKIENNVNNSFLKNKISWKEYENIKPIILKERFFLSKSEKFTQVEQEIFECVIDSQQFKIIFYNIAYGYPGLSNEERGLLIRIAKMKKDGLKLEILTKDNYSEYFKKLKGLNLQTTNDIWTIFEVSNINCDKTFYQPSSKTYADVTPSLKESIRNFSFNSKKRDDWFLQLKKTYLTKISEEPSEKKGFETRENPNDEIDPAFKDCVEKLIKHYDKDCRVAEKNGRRKFEINLDQLNQLETKLNEEIEKNSNNIEILEHYILKTSNRMPTDLYAYAHRQAFLSEHKVQKISIDQVCRIAASQDAIEKLQSLNPYILPEDLDLLRIAALDFMAEVTHLRQVKIVKEALNTYQEDAENQGLQDTLIEEISKKRRYDLQTLSNPEQFRLLFEYTSGMRLKKAQLKLIDTIYNTLIVNENITENYGLAFQLIMAGGKTSVIFSTLLEIMAEKTGKLVCAVCHHSQYASVRGNLVDFQKTRFQKDVIGLEATLVELNDPKVLQSLLGKITRAKVTKSALLMTSSFPQVLLAKFNMDCLKLPKDAEEIPETLELLTKILNELGDSIAFFDECDSTLSMMTEVHIPIGKAHSLPQDEAEVIQWFYQQLITDPELKNLIKLNQNKQTDLSSEDYKTTVLPKLVDLFIQNKNYSINIPEPLKGAYHRYLKGAIPFDDQEEVGKNSSMKKLSSESKENVDLLTFIQEAAASKNKVKKRKTELVGTARYLLEEIIPLALKRSYNQHYGPPAKGQPNLGRVIPYQGVGEPAITQFGNPYLALALHVQAAIGGEIAKDEIEFLAAKMRESAEHYASLDSCSMLNTLEAQLFQKLTGVTLKEVITPEGIEKALKYINNPDHLEYKIEFRANVVPFHINYHPDEVSITPIQLATLFKHGIAGSGTLYNAPSYHKCFGQPKLDEGTEGLILNKMSEDQTLLVVEDESLQSLLNIIDTHPQSKKIKALIDSGGFLKEASTDKLAIKILENLRHLEAIIYLPSGSSQFVLLKQSIDGEFPTPIPLANTNRKEILKHLKKFDDLFVIFDDLRTTGTDIPLAKDAICLQTHSPRAIIRNHLQGALRAREFFKNQKVLPIMTEKGIKELWIKEKTTDALLLSEKKNEAVVTSKQTLQSVFAQMGDFFRLRTFKKLSQAVAEKNVKAITSMSESERASLFTRKNFCDYANWLRVPCRAPIEKVLEKFKSDLISNNMGDERLDEFVEGVLEENFKSNLPTLANLSMGSSIEENFKSNLPTLANLSMGSSIENEVQVEVCQEVAVEKASESETYNELMSELQLELEKFQFSNDVPYKEKPWNFETTTNTQSSTVINFLKESQLRNGTNASKYGDYFPENLCISTNLRFTSSSGNLVFDAKFKECHFVGIVGNNDNVPLIMLTDKEAAKWMNYPDLSNKNMHLFTLDGIPVLEHSSPELLNTVHLKKALWFANFFNGNIDYLVKNKKYTKELLKDVEKISDYGRYLQLKNANNKARLMAITESNLFGIKVEALLKNTGVTFAVRRKFLEAHYLKNRAKHKETVAMLVADQVPFIKAKYVSWLTNQEQIEALPDNLINNATATQLQWLTDDQFPYLQEDQLKIFKNLVDQEDNKIPPLHSWQVQYYGKHLFKFESSSSLVKGLTDQQLKDFDPKKKSHLGWIHNLALSQLENVEDNVLALITNEQICNFSENDSSLIDRLTDAQRVHLTAEVLKEKNLIDSFKQTIEHWNEEELKTLHHDKSSLLTKEVVKKLNFNSHEELINHLPETSLKYLSQQTVQNIDPETHQHLIQGLAPKQLLFLTEEQSRKLTNKQIDDFKEQINNEKIKSPPRHEWQVPYFGSKCFNFESSPNLAKGLSKEQLNSLDPIHKIWIEQLTTNQLNHVSDQVLEKITDQQIAAFTENDDELIQRLDVNQLNHLPKRCLDSLSNQQWDNLTENQSDFIQRLDVNQLNHLPERCLEYLSNEQLGNLTENDSPLIDRLTDAQRVHLTTEVLKEKNLIDSFRQTIEHWNEEELKTLHHDKSSLLTKEVVKKLDFNSHKELINHLPETSLKYLSQQTVENIDPETHQHLIQGLVSEQLLLLTEEQSRKLKNKQINDFKEQIDNENIKSPPTHQWQVPYFGSKCFNFKGSSNLAKGLSEKQLNSLDPIHETWIEQLTTNQLKHVSNEVLKKITDQQIAAFTENDKDLLQKLDVNQLNHLPERCLDSLSNQQWGNLTENQSDFIQRLDVNQLNHLPERCLEYLSNQQWGNLTENQSDFIQRLDVNQLNHLPERCLDSLSNQQWDNLTENQSDFIQRLDVNQLNHLPERCLKYLSNEQLGHLTENQSDFIQRLDVNQLNHLPERCLDSLSNQQWGNLTENQSDFIQRLDVNQLNHLPERCLKYLSNEQLGHLTEDQSEFIQRLDVNQLNHLPKRCLKYLSNEQLGHLTENQPELIQKLDVNQLNHLPKRCLKYLSSEQLGNLTENQPELIQKLDVNQLNHLPESCLDSLSNQQWGNLTENQSDFIQRLDVNQLNHLPERCLDSLSNQQWDNLTENQSEFIEKLPIEFIDRLKEPLHYLIAKQITSLKFKDLPQKIDSLWVNFLSKKQLSKLDRKRLPNDLLIKLKPKNYNFLSTNILRSFTSINDKALIDKCSETQVAHLTATVLRESNLIDPFQKTIKNWDSEELKTLHEDKGLLLTEEIISQLDERHEHLVRALNDDLFLSLNARLLQENKVFLNRFHKLMEKEDADYSKVSVEKANLLPDSAIAKLTQENLNLIEVLDLNLMQHVNIDLIKRNNDLSRQFVKKLNEASVQEIIQFPKDKLSEFLSIEKLSEFSLQEIRDIYGAKDFRGILKNSISGLFSTLWNFMVIPFESSQNIVKCIGITLGTLASSRKYRELWLPQIKETCKSPIRRLCSTIGIVSYPTYLYTKSRL